MRRIVSIAGGLLSLALIAACQSGAAEAPASAPEPAAAPAPAPAADPAPAAGGMRMVTSGVYTAAQADRGEQVFQTECVDCHATSEWQDAAFLRRWTGQPLMRLYTYIHLNMPGDDPRSLSEQQVSDVITYIFELNGMPTGSTELDADPYTLEEIQIDWMDVN